MLGMSLIPAPVDHATSRPAAASPDATPVGQLLWSGADDALRRSAADHVDAAGMRLADTASPLPDLRVIGEIRSLDAMRRRAPRRSRDLPMIVVADDAADIAPDLWRRALELGVTALVQLPSGSHELLAALSAMARPRARAAVIAVAGGNGGAGASSFAARLAGAASRRGLSTVLVDADPLGGGLDVLVEEPRPGGIRWSDVGPLGPEDGASLRDGLPLIDGVRLLTAQDGRPAHPEHIGPVLHALRGTSGIVILDAGASPDPRVLHACDLVLLVALPTDIGLLAARRRLDAWALPSAQFALVIRGSGPTSASDAARDLGVELAGSFRDHQRGTVPLLDRRRGGADRLCARIIDRLDAQRGAA